MLRTGRVVSAKDGELQVCFQRPEACAHCSAACGGQAHETLVAIPGDAPVGRWIDVDMPEGQVLKASAWAYVMPLALLLLGLWVGSLLFENEALWAVTGIACMLLSWFILRLLDKRVRSRGPWQPKIVAVHEEDAFCAKT
ncbi:MAG: SoxR reducing system RseC family protein [Clostridia bacterium]|nr:SoxR reducing system RseC family protein [Clostridia bacterium]